MKLSHSKLSTLLSCPMTYYLTYVEGIFKAIEKPALAIGSAVHWGIEHNTEDLTEYFHSEQSSYTKEQLLSEAMVHGYLKHKDEIFEEILKDPETGEKLTLEDETHELYVTGKLESFKYEVAHDFVGIIDLLLLTNKGFVIIDYKTSTYEPDWDGYLDQIYRYIFLLNSYFPDMPVVKVGIVNIRKSGIRQKKSENTSDFMNRLKFEYDLNDEHYVNYHEFPMSSLDSKLISAYIHNLSKMADTAQMIVDNKMWFINYGAANGTYGKSDFWEIFYKVPDAHFLYKISDTIWDEETQSFTKYRDCVPIDMQVIDNTNVLNHYEKFEEEYKLMIDNLAKHSTYSKADFIAYLKEKYIVDDDLLDKYFKTYLHKIIT